MIPDPDFKYRGDRPKCPKKRSYDSLEKAKQAAEMANKKGGRYTAYICPRCRWAHLGPGRPMPKTTYL